MKIKHAALLLSAMAALCVNAFGQPITLSGSTGVRSGAMGGAGYALSDDETSLFYNPAGLGLKNERWNGGALHFSTMDYYYGFIRDYYGIAYQNENLAKFGFSLYANRIENLHFSDEYTYSGGFGYDVYSDGFISNAVGAAIKYYYKKVSMPESGVIDEVFTGPVIVDVGYLLQIKNRLRIGIVFKNIGTNITGTIKDSIAETERLPFEIAGGIGYKDAFDFENLRILDLSFELSYAGVNPGYSHWSQNFIQTGIDLQFFRIFSAQLGYSVDLTNNIAVVSWGTGCSLFNHFEFNFSVEKVKFDYTDDVRVGLSTSFKRVLNWSKKDRRWWLE
jgi:hypothetical protein